MLEFFLYDTILSIQKRPLEASGALSAHQKVWEGPSQIKFLVQLKHGNHWKQEETPEQNATFSLEWGKGCEEWLPG